MTKENQTVQQQQDSSHQDNGGQENAMAVRQAQVAVTTKDLNITSELIRQAQHLVDSGLLPDSIKKPSQAVVIMQTGKELGFTPMASFSNIFVVNGVPSLSGKAMAGLLRRGGVKYVTEKDAEHVYAKNAEGKQVLVDYVTEIAFHRDGLVEKVRFTWKDAKDAGLVTRDVWKKYLKVMMWWRCFSLGAKRVAPDLILGMYETSELADVHGTHVVIDGEGEVINIAEEQK